MGDRFDDDFKDDFRDKPSWRDRDRKKDRSRHVSSDDYGSSQGSGWVRKQVLREAEKLFQGGGAPAKKLDPEQEKARKEIHKAFGTKKFPPAVKKYLKQYGLAEDWSTLMLLLDYNDTETVVGAIEKLKGLLPGRGLEEQQGLRSKLNIIAMTTKDDHIRICAEETGSQI